MIKLFRMAALATISITIALAIIFGMERMLGYQAFSQIEVRERLYKFK